MRRLILALLPIFAVGCATLPSPDPAGPVAPRSSPVKQLDSAPAPVAKKAEPSVARETPFEPAPPVSTEASLPAAPEKSASKQEETSAVAQRKQEKPAPSARELPVPNHKLQGLVDLAEKNDEKIANVYVGMYRKTVENIMGTVRNPYKRETITRGEDQVYEIVYYLTREPRKGRPITDRMLTPVIYKKGRVAAIGTYKLKKLIRTGTLGRQKPAKETPPASS